MTAVVQGGAPQQPMVIHRTSVGAKQGWRWRVGVEGVLALLVALLASISKSNHRFTSPASGRVLGAAALSLS